MRERSPYLNVIGDAFSYFNSATSLKMFDKMCSIRFFEENVADAFKKGHIKMPIYLSRGQEALPAALASVYSTGEFALFAQHRGHGFYLAFGGNEDKLIDELLHRKTGCAGGMGGSASIHCPEIKMFGHDGLMGSQVPISVGYALGKSGLNNREKQESRQKVITVMGDASGEEDYALASIPYAVRKNLPVLFICNDNNLSILTPVNVRRDFNLAKVAGAFGSKYYFDFADDPWTIMHNAREVQDFENLPSFMNIHSSRDIWHAGAGNDGEPEWNRFEMVKETFKKMGLEKRIREIEEEKKEHYHKLWGQKLNE